MKMPHYNLTEVQDKRIFTYLSNRNCIFLVLFVSCAIKWVIEQMCIYMNIL